MPISTEMLEALAQKMQARGWMLVSAESCTGGLIASACTELAGSSFWFDRGFVTYSNEAKSEMLGVDPALITAHGAVSEAVARAMAQGALTHSKAQVAVSVTGIAGPSGGSPDKPVGTVCFSFALLGQQVSEQMQFSGNRTSVRAASVSHALKRLLELIG